MLFSKTMVAYMADDKSSIGLIYGHVATNLGDLAINEGVLSLCAKHLPHGDVSVYLRNPNPRLIDRSVRALKVRSLEFYGLQRDKEYEPYDIRSMLELLRMLTQPRAWIASSGASFPDIIIGNGGEHFYEAADGRNLLELLWRVAPLVVGASIGKRVIQVPSTFGPLNGPDLRSLLGVIAAVTPGLIARDKESQRLLEDKGLRAETALDPAFMLPQIDTRQSRQKHLAIIPRLENFGMRAGPSLSSYEITKARKDGFSSTIAYQWARAVAVKAVSQGWKVDLYIQTLADRDLVRQLAADLSSEGYQDHLRVLYPHTVESYRELLSSAAGVVSSRFHANVLALAMGVPAVGLFSHSHGHKMPGLYEMLGMSRAAIEVEADTPVDLANRAFRELESMSSLNADWRRRLRELKAKTDAWFVKAISSQRSRTSAAMRLALCSMVTKLIEGEIENVEKYAMHFDGQAEILKRLDSIHSLMRGSRK